MSWGRWISAEDVEPKRVGWYPTLWVMPDSEGIMPRSTEWDGVLWKDGNVDYFIPQVCATAEEALALAYENDVEAD